MSPETLMARARRAGDAMAEPAGVSVVVPVYRSAEILPELTRRLVAVLGDLDVQFEVLLVNDGSPDDSWDVIQGLARGDGRIRGITLMRNYGQHNALLCGIRASRYATIATVDDDLQHPPEALPTLLAALEAGADVVYGTPEVQQHGFLRDAASLITRVALQGAMGVESARQASAFRVFRTGLRRSFSAYRGSFVSIDVLLTWGTRNFAAVRVPHEPRRVGRSNYTVGKLLTHAVTMVTGFSTLPLRLASAVGLAFTFFGIGVLGYVLVRLAMTHGSVPGFPFLASIIAIFSGAQLFALGIIGEYLARVHMRSLDRPPFVVRDSTEAALSDDPAR